MSKSGGSLPRGRRRSDEIPPVPSSDGLTHVQRSAQVLLRELVHRVGGREGSGPAIPIDQLVTLCDLFDEWARRHGERCTAGIRFSGRPGLWHALDDLYPLQDPNRWDLLRKAVLEQLESTHWTRLSPPRGSAFEIRA